MGLRESSNSLLLRAQKEYFRKLRLSCIRTAQVVPVGVYIHFIAISSAPRNNQKCLPHEALDPLSLPQSRNALLLDFLET